MRQRRFPLAALVMVCASFAACSRQSAPVDRLAEHWAVIDRYCSDCHNDAEYSGELSFEQIEPAIAADSPEIFEKVVRKLRGDLMPPPGQPRPAGEDIDALATAIEDTLDGAAAQRGPMPGNVPLHRLNRTEYAAAIEQLLGLSIDARDMLPADVSSDGFDNVAEVLGVSPTHLDQYIAAAREISIMAVGQQAPDPARSDYRTERGNRTAHVDGLPLGTRGGLAVRHNFPSDGTYQINVGVTSIPGSELRGYPYGWLEYEHRLIVVVDGKKVFEDTIGGPEDSRTLDQRQITGVDEIRSRFQNIRIPVEAGVREIGVAFVKRSYAEGDYLLESQVPGEGVPDIPRLSGVEIIGPFAPAGIGGTTLSREKIFSCYPRDLAERGPCARTILTQLAERAFRRPVAAEELEPVFAFYESGAAAEGFEGGIQKGLMAILASTKFLYRAEPERPDVPGADSQSYRISDLELAWRLAFFLWSQGPDDELLARVEDGTLTDPIVYESQVRRMLADPRSESLVTNFAYQWLDVRRLDAIDPDPRLFPTFDEDLRAAFRTEMRLFLDSILRADRSVIDLLDADHTFVNERLARHYGIADVRGDRFRRIRLADETRHGLFGKGSMLLVTSYPDRTSPVLRGAWIMEHLLAAPPNPPPPEVETDLAPVVGDVPRSVRERLALHRELASCNQCHGVIDPLGQALENFDAIGEWRIAERDSGVEIDSSGLLADGTVIDGPVQLRAALKSRPERFVRALAEKLMVYALGRGVRWYDMPSVRAIVDRAAAQEYRFSSIVLGIAESDAFRMRQLPAEAENRAALAAGRNLQEL